MKTLYLHIGTHRTGTTTIQYFCHQNQSLLASKGLCYPDMPFKYYDKSATRNGLFLGAIYRDKTGRRCEDIEEKNLHEGFRIISELFNEYDNIMLSNERMWIDLCENDARILKLLKDESVKHGYRLRFIMYVRRQDIFIESWWNQVIKLSRSKTTDFWDYANNYNYLNYYRILRKYEEIAGADSILVRRFDEAVKNGGIIRDIMQQMGLELTGEYVIENDIRNISFSGNNIYIKKAVNCINGLSVSDNLFVRKGIGLAEASSYEGKYSCSVFSDEERAEFMREYEDDNELLADRYIGDGRPLFSCNYKGAPQYDMNNPEMINDVIRASFGVSIVLHRQLLETQRDIRKYEKRIASLERRVDHIRHPLRWLIQKLRMKNS